MLLGFDGLYILLVALLGCSELVCVLLICDGVMGWVCGLVGLLQFSLHFVVIVYLLLCWNC